MVRLLAFSCMLLAAGGKAADLPAGTLWRDPGDVASLELAGGPLGRGGAPRPPFMFNEEDSGGTSPKVIVRDASGRYWSVKWGPEVHAEVFASRLVWAAGYFADAAYFVPEGTMQSVGALSRAESVIDRANGNAFRNARFELREDNVFPMPHGWDWNRNPFLGTRELNGLKIMAMLVSNWDLKDTRDKGGNTIVLRVKKGGQEEILYGLSDWGASMGKWGGLLTREKWDCEGYAGQSGEFVRISGNGELVWGFEGKHASEIKSGIKVDDVRWLMQYLGRITDAQLRAGLSAAGARGSDLECFTQAVRGRIEMLRGTAGRSSEGIVTGLRK